MEFKILGAISAIETFAEGKGVRIRRYLNATYAGGRKMYWRHCKGRATVHPRFAQLRFALWKNLTKVRCFRCSTRERRTERVQYVNGEIWDAEVHWFECHGLGRCRETVKHKFRRLDK